VSESEDSEFYRNLRLAISGFSEEEAEEIAALVREVWAPNRPWVVSQEVPADGVLLGRGTRTTDPEHSAVLRVNLNPAGRSRREIELALEPILIRKPVRASALKIALDTAIVRLRRFQR
jgi:hypothetical protein